jgi:hypothetical protein
LISWPEIGRRRQHVCAVGLGEHMKISTEPEAFDEALTLTVAQKGIRTIGIA